MVLFASRACGGSDEEALPAACAVEMVHAYSLIHDDLPAMDDDDLRRGQPTCHTQFGEATAILAGDALLARAFEIIARDVQPAETAARCGAALGKAAGARALVGGQQDDLAGERSAASGVSKESPDFENRLVALESIHHRKTGALFLVSLELGGLTAGADEAKRAGLAAYGRHLGLAFQITDDLLDISGEESTVGKRLRKDTQHGKMTFPALLGAQESRRRAAGLVRQAIAAITQFGPQGDPLIRLAEMILERKS